LPVRDGRMYLNAPFVARINFMEIASNHPAAANLATTWRCYAEAQWREVAGRDRSGEQA
jgi:hypothetical protein